MKIKYSTAIALFAVFFLISASLPAEAALSHEDAGKVWRKVASATGLENLPFNVKVEKIPNAWVTNGQSVTVTTGLLAMLSTKAELYGVLAHEAGHAKLGHYEKTVNRAAGLGVAASILGNIFGGGIEFVHHAAHAFSRADNAFAPGFFGLFLRLVGFFHSLPGLFAHAAGFLGFGVRLLHQFAQVGFHLAQGVGFLAELLREPFPRRRF